VAEWRISGVGVGVGLLGEWRGSASVEKVAANCRRSGNSHDSVTSNGNVRFLTYDHLESARSTDEVMELEDCATHTSTRIDHHKETQFRCVHQKTGSALMCPVKVTSSRLAKTSFPCDELHRLVVYFACESPRSTRSMALESRHFHRQVSG
jgi:hypothetical protein